MAISLSTAPASVNLSKNPVYVRLLSSGTSGLVNYRAVLRVEVEKVYSSGTYTQIAEIEAVPDSSGFSNFDLQSILHTCMERYTSLQVPDLENPLPYNLDTLRRFKIKYLEKYGTPQVEQTVTTSSVYKVICGGVDNHYFGLYDFFSNLSATNSLLTYYPSGKIIARDQPEYLTYIQQASAISPHAFIRINEYDNEGVLLGTHDSYRLNADYPYPVFLNRYESAVFPTSAEALVISATAVKYTVQVWAVESLATPGGNIENGSAAAASQMYTYYIDDAVQPNPHDIIWLGGFRNPHILRCTGRKRTRLSVERFMSEQVVPFGYDPRSAGVVQHRRSFEQPLSFRSGSLKPEEIDALQEMLIENILLEYTADGNYYRLSLTGNNFDVYEDGVSPNALEFAAVRALAPGSYMKLRPLSGDVPDADLWQTNSNGFWELNVTGGFLELN